MGTHVAAGDLHRAKGLVGGMGSNGMNGHDNILSGILRRG